MVTKAYNDISILHLVPDEKFIDSAYYFFELVAPSCNTFFLPSRTKKLDYIKKTPVTFIDPFSFKNPYFMKKLEKYNFIVLHSLNKYNQELVAHANPKLKFLWIGMGYDYYDLICDSEDSLYQEKTKLIISKMDNTKDDIFLKFKHWVKNKLYMNMGKKQVISKIAFFSPVLKNEYFMVAQNFNSKFPIFIEWNYGSTSKLIEGKIENINLNSNNILVGNSATPTNNHIEIFDFLNNQDLKGKKIICPLSYGDRFYATILKNKGKCYFGIKFYSVEEFMPYEEYMHLISSCSNVIMNHHRQQALGNITAMMYMGAKIYLNKMNPIYMHYKEKGAVLFTIDELYNNPSLLDLSLSKKDIENNKRVIKSMYREEHGIEKTGKLITSIMSSSQKNTNDY
ncbi:TDP-N-acetylfucosamine:lipid II N-acetylfucosaminyltransferase [Methanolobus sp. ZRKC5]|uniref:TDP-N-acetylfucosamine:lipid II N-acetylfucosaminyltransferase n=1 Tax=unclassified Methanolobus TaxID=2629569 RepID=UPI00313D1703